MVQSAFLRSINIQLDAGHPERFEHFRPTSKSVRLVSSLLESKKGSAVFVVAPYGSGKSITTGYLGHLVDNRPEAARTLRLVEDRLTGVSLGLQRRAARRRTEARRGLFVPIYGHVDSAPAALAKGLLGAMRRTGLDREARTVAGLEAARVGDIPALVDACLAKLQQSGRDRLVIVWDEFGRHLQGLISEGRPEELDALQVLAEVASRSSGIPVSLALLLHRSLLGYATGLPPGLRREWAKIEGRFETLQYLDDSTELYELVGSLVEESRTVEASDADFASLAAEARDAGMFPDIAEDRLTGVLAAAHPLAPATVYLLPRVAARVAQNERTLFSFLQWASLDAPVSPGALYDYFRGDFRTDGGAGGTQRPWLETESALGKVPGDSLEAEALKSAFLLSLGLSGERSHATRKQLAFALGAVCGRRSKRPARAIGELVKQRLLVHRRHSDQVVVWHGTDVDLRGRLEDEKMRHADDFDLASFLAHELPPPVWRPVEYNAKHGIRRYLDAEYATVAGLAASWDRIRLEGWKPGTDGRVLHVLPQDADEFAQAQKLAACIDDPRLFVAVAREVSALRDAAVDLWCLLRMHADQDMIGNDPVVGAELDHLTDDARTALQPFADRVLRPQPNGSRWFHRGRPVEATGLLPLRRAFSQTMEAVFSRTPEIDSEMVVRRSPSPVIVNARKKVELGLLERCGQKDLGIKGNSADKAIFRCVFLRTGLYCQNGSLSDLKARKTCQNGSVLGTEGEKTCQNGRTWKLAAPETLENRPGLQAVWARVRDFFTEPGKAKGFQALLDELMEPPFGVREGLLPLMLAAGFRAFPTVAAVRCRDRFVDDLLPSVIEDIAKHPDRYVLDVVGISAKERTYLEGVRDLFEGSGDGAVNENDLLRACMEAVVAWRRTLPGAVVRSRHVSPPARSFVEEIEAPDPVGLFLDRLPQWAGATVAKPRQLLNQIAKLKGELDDVGNFFRREAVLALSDALVARGMSNGVGNGVAAGQGDASGTDEAPGGNGAVQSVGGAGSAAVDGAAPTNGVALDGVRRQAVAWASYFPKAFASRLPDQVAKGVLNRLRARYDDDDALVNALSTLLLGLPVQQWDDATISTFRRQLRNAFEVIETTATTLARESDLDPTIRSGLVRLADARTRQVAEQLAEMLGTDEAARRLETLAGALRARSSPAVAGAAQ